MESLEQFLLEGCTTAQTVQKMKASFKQRGHEVNKHKDGGENGVHVLYHSTSTGDRYKSVVKGDTVTTRPARAGEAVHFTKKPSA